MTNQFSNAQNPDGELDLQVWVLLMCGTLVCSDDCGPSGGQVARRAGLVARTTLRNGASAVCRLAGDRSEDDNEDENELKRGQDARRYGAGGGLCRFVSDISFSSVRGGGHGRGWTWWTDMDGGGEWASAGAKEYGVIGLLDRGAGKPHFSCPAIRYILKEMKFL